MGATENAKSSVKGGISSVKSSATSAATNAVLSGPRNISNLANGQLNQMSGTLTTLSSIGSKAQKGANLLTAHTKIPKGGGIAQGAAALNTIFSAINIVGQTIISGIQGVISGVLGSIQNVVDNTVGEVMDAVGDAVEDVAGDVVDAASDAVDAVEDTASSALNSAKEVASNAAGAVSNKVSGMMKDGGMTVSLNKESVSNVSKNMNLSSSDISKKTASAVTAGANATQGSNSSSLDNLKQRASEEDKMNK